MSINYRTLLTNYTQERKEELIKLITEYGGKNPIKAVEKAHDLTYEILNNRFANELKKYNYNEERAYDHYIAAKNLGILNIFIEEFLPLYDAKDIDFHYQVRKEMRNLLHDLFGYL